LALVYLPLIGVVLFLIFGIKSLSEKTLNQFRKELIRYSVYEKYDYTDEILNSQKNNIFSYGYTTSLRPVYKNNNIEIIKNNADLYSQTIELIRSAKKTIHIQMYLIKDGFFLRTVFAELIKKAKQKVKIRFLYD
jgi:cardiolipin synthase